VTGVEKWELIDDCANWLQSGNIEAGRIELKSRASVLQQYFETQYARWQQAKVATFAFSAASLGYAAYSVTARGLAASSFEIAWAAAGFAATAVAWNLPSILQQLPKSWGHPNVFGDAALEPLKTYLSQLADSDRRIVSVKGEAIDRAILKSDWALLYLTDADEFQALPRLVGKGIWIKHYSSRLLVEKPPLLRALDRREKVQQVHFHLDNRSIAITINQQLDVTEVHNHFEFVTRLRENAAPIPSRNVQMPASKPTPPNFLKRWPCTFDDDDYEIRLLIFRTETLPKLTQVKSHQFQKYVVAIDGARKYWLEDQNLTIDKLAEKLGSLVAKSSDKYAGLNQSASVAWIRSLISGQGKYAFVKESFEAIQYDPEQYQAVQYRMLSE
jgi:hypothetical protein